MTKIYKDGPFRFEITDNSIKIYELLNDSENIDVYKFIVKVPFEMINVINNVIREARK